MKLSRTSLLLLILLSSALIMGSCSTGYTGKSGAHLEQYLEPDAMKALLESESTEILVIDVRPESAYKNGHLPGALSVPSPDFSEWFEANMPEQDIIVYCETGGRAQTVVKYLEGEDFDNVMNWGGYTRWDWEYEKGLPVTED